MTYLSKTWSFTRFSTFLTTATLLLCTACGTAKSESADTAIGAGRNLRIALLTPGPISDLAWNGGAYRGLMQMKDSLGARVSHIQTKTPAEYDENFRLYGEQGYALAIGHGFEYQDAAARVAPDFPKTVYVSVGGDRSGANIASLEFAFEDGAYLAGIVAGAATKTGTIGAIGGQEMPPVSRSFYAFEAGAKSINPNVNVIISYVGNWDDAAADLRECLM